MLAAGAPSPESYVERVSRDTRELLALCEALRVGETRFFRHRAHVEALERRVIPRLGRLRASERKILGWSAGCATGEEAFTLAILLRERLPQSFAIRVL